MAFDNYLPGETVRYCINSSDLGSGEGVTLGGSPAVVVYKDNNVNESSSGTSITFDYDTRTGLIQVAVSTSSDASFYSAGSSFWVVFSAGTVNGKSLNGKIVGAFRLTNERALVRQIYAGVVGLSSTTTSIVCSSIGMPPSNTTQLKGRVVIFDDDTTTADLRGTPCEITSSTTGSTPTLTVSVLPVAPATGDKFKII